MNNQQSMSQRNNNSDGNNNDLWMTIVNGTQRNDCLRKRNKSE